MRVQGISISHPEKLLFPESGLRKDDLVHYFERVAPYMLPELRGRPISLVCCPEGAGEGCFFQKHPRKGMPKDVRRISIRSKSSGKREDYNVIEDQDDLVQLAQMNVLEVHVWGSREPWLECPDRIVFDLDPGSGVRPALVVEGATLLREILGALGLETFVKSTGGKGLHVVSPILQRQSWDEVKKFSESIARLIAREEPRRYVATMSKARRDGKIFIDYLRNGRGATAVANYSPRARPGAPIAVPLFWDELSTRKELAHWNLENIFRRLRRGFRDPWEDIDRSAVALPAPVSTP